MTRKQRVLVIDDDAATGHLIAACCDAWGLQAIVTTSAWEAMDIAGNGRPPDVILTDFMMPGMNGHELILALRSNPKLKRVPTVLMSAAPDAARGGSPADAFIAKPVDVDELERTLRHWLERDRRRRAGGATPQRIHERQERRRN